MSLVELELNTSVEGSTGNGTHAPLWHPVDLCHIFSIVELFEDGRKGWKHFGTDVCTCV